MRYTVDVTAGLAFGADINTIESDDEVIQRHLDKVLPALFRRVMSPLPAWRWLGYFTGERKVAPHLHALRAAVREFIAQARARMEAEPGRREHPQNLIEAMLAARDTPGSGLEDGDVAGNVLTMLLALTTLSTTQQPIRLYTTPTPPSREVLEKLSLDLAWRVKLPTAGRRDGIYSVQIAPGKPRMQLLVQTHQGVLFALDAEKGDILWQVQLGSEYWPMQPDDLHAYHRFMREHLFDHVDIPPDQIHLPDGTVPRDEVECAAREYEQAIERAGGIDFQILGIGRTGHVGFNEPGSGRASRTRLVTLDLITRREAAARADA